jgi:hypothetical protein
MKADNPMPTLLTCDAITINLDQVTHIEESGSAMLVWFGAHHIKLAGAAAQTLRDWLQLHALPTAERASVEQLTRIQGPQRPVGRVSSIDQSRRGPGLIGEDETLD